MPTADFKFPDLPRTAGAMHSPDRTAKTMTKAELAEALFDRLGLNNAKQKTWSMAFSMRFGRRSNAVSQ